MNKVPNRDGSFRTYFHSLWNEPTVEQNTMTVKGQPMSYPDGSNLLWSEGLHQLYVNDESNKVKKNNLKSVSLSKSSRSSNGSTISLMFSDTGGLFDNMILCCLGDASETESDTDEDQDDGSDTDDESDIDVDYIDDDLVQNDEESEIEDDGGDSESSDDRRGYLKI